MDLLNVERLRARGTPALSFLWVCSFFDSRVKILSPNDLTFIESISLPFPGLDSTNFTTSGRTKTIAGFETTDALTINFFESDTYDILLWLQDWQFLIRDRVSGNYSVPNAYRGTAKFLLLNNSGKGIVSAAAANIFPTAQAPIEHHYNDSSRVVISKTFSVDRVTYKRAS